jgi:hypothetical protein
MQAMGIDGQAIGLEEVVSDMVTRFKTEFREPEEKVVEQFDDTDSLYLIAKGACKVTLKDQKKNEHQLKNLRPGDFFGEISLVYGCKRTATVISSKYSTLAVLHKNVYKEVLIEFPDLQAQLKKQIFKYNDRMKRFIVKSIEKVEYFRDIGEDALHDIIYNLKGRKCLKGTILQEPGDNATKLFFLEDGVIEIFTYTD